MQIITSQTLNGPQRCISVEEALKIALIHACKNNPHMEIAEHLVAIIAVLIGTMADSGMLTPEQVNKLLAPLCVVVE